MVLDANAVVFVDDEPSGPHKNAVFELLVRRTAGLEKDNSSAVARGTQPRTGSLSFGLTSNPPVIAEYQLYSQFFLVQ